ncbi:alcohol dehydrogenase [Lentzea sp. NBRC 105346]|uniref:zinc-binding alcohol dehydrogenase family protein n=1 Tax=Lentzea sp. NBRC 105346 TaxID=3032205 RepID=UPI0024A2A5E5|nr:zinc-binding alcohol dehydrogenase family protein [Lentzea sp. NBRC 105346]GLZ31675.1 alcohol dehydrogenase [Lentzea sp. NBRC 105346]
MLAWRTAPLEACTVEVPSPGPGELLVRVLASGVCRTDLHVVDGDLPVHRPRVTPGHEVVGSVVVGSSAFPVGTRVGIPWLRHTCGSCRFCSRGAENLCPSSEYTGWDADGGYAEYAIVPVAYALPLPSGYSDVELAPLLCAGIIGYRALERALVPPGGTLGIWGFGGSAHLAAQVAIARGISVHVVTRSVEAQSLALSLGATSASSSAPSGLDSAILFAPVGSLVPQCLAALAPGGTLAIAGIHLTDVPPLVYQDHLFYERQVRSVTANTRADAHAFLSFAASCRLEVSCVEYPLASAMSALDDLRAGRVRGAAVLVP